MTLPAPAGHGPAQNQHLRQKRPPKRYARPAKIQIEPNDLTQINGIGPVMSKRLNRAGIFTFLKLASSTTEELRLALGESAKIRQPGDVDQTGQEIKQLNSMFASVPASLSDLRFSMKISMSGALSMKTKPLSVTSEAIQIIPMPNDSVLPEPSKEFVNTPYIQDVTRTRPCLSQCGISGAFFRPVQAREKQPLPFILPHNSAGRFLSFTEMTSLEAPT